MEDEEYKKLPAEEKCVHKLWKARVCGFEEVTTLFRQIDNEKSPEFGKYLGLVKKFVTDSNAMAQEKGLEATLAYVENYAHAGKTVSEVMSGIVCKCIAAPKTKTRELALQVTLMYIEIEKHEFVCEELLKGTEQKNPKIVAACIQAITTALREFGIKIISPKPIIKRIGALFSDRDKNVRDETRLMVVELYRWMGPGIKNHLQSANLQPVQMTELEGEFAKLEEQKPVPLRYIRSQQQKQAKLAATATEEGNGVEEEAEEEETPPDIDPYDLADPVDILSKLPKDFHDKLESKKWQDRKEVLEALETLLKNPKLENGDYGDVVRALKKVVQKDSNVICVAIGGKCIAGLATGLKNRFQQYAGMLFLPLLEKFKEKKQNVVAATREAVDATYLTTNLEVILEDVLESLNNKNPSVKSETCLFLARAFTKTQPSTVNKKLLKAITGALTKNINEPDPGVREAAAEALGTLMKLVGDKAIGPFLVELEKDALKITKIREYCEKAEITIKIIGVKKPKSKSANSKESGDGAPSAPPRMKKSTSDDNTSKKSGLKSAGSVASEKQADAEEKPVRGTKPVASKQNAVKKGGSKSAPSGSRKKEEDVDTSPLLVVNNLKHQRTIDESKLKVLKWNFTTPREEYVELLKDQMMSANVNRTLISNMFHTDFRFHIKALESLTEDLPDHNEALIANLDLIFKWLTLRFFDTNPSVLLKGLEYLHSVFDMLIKKQYHMLENEGSSFIPYLILKIGDPKDSVRNGVKALLKQISGVFSVSRLSVYVMDGIKSKNARQRAECLDVMGSMIEDYNITVCQPTPTACLKEVAKQISDRDNSVRNAALNCIIQAYHIVGEKVYKMVGNISDKDMSLLEERIKRSNRKTIVPKIPVVSEPVPQVVPLPRNGSNEAAVFQAEEDQDMDEEEAVPMPVLPPTVIQEPPKREVQGPFKLESEFMRDLDKLTPHFEKLPIAKIDTAFLKEEVELFKRYDNEAKIMPLSPPKPVIANKYGLHQRVAPTDPEIDKLLKMIGLKNIVMAQQGLMQFYDIMNSPTKVQIFVNYEEEFINSIISLLQYLGTLDPVNDPSVARIYKDTFKAIDTFYHKPQLGKRIAVGSLKQLINELIRLLVEGNLEKCGDLYVKVVNVNCVKVIEGADHTAIICALIQLMTESIGDDRCPERHIDLVMKCLWKVIKLMPGWGDNVDYELVFLEVHQFLAKFPSKWWTRRPADTPLRTIKTILHSTVKIKGANSMQLLGKIPNSAESEIEAYVLRLLKTLKIAQAQDVPIQSQSQRNALSRANHNMLTEIFQKIGNKDETKEGLNLLYDFMEQHPEADIQPFLSKSSNFFQEYIKSGLKDIELLRNHQNHTGFN